MHLTPFRRRALLTALSFVAIACAEGPFDPEVEDIVGNYEAVEFFVTQGEDSTDFLGDGVEITITLNEDFTTTGRFFAPSIVEGGAALNQSLAGTWDFEGRTIVFDHAAETALRNTPFKVPRAGQLEIREELSNARYVMVLRRLE